MGYSYDAAITDCRSCGQPLWQHPERRDGEMVLTCPPRPTPPPAAEVIPEFVVALTCPDCYEMPYDCRCHERVFGCTEETPCPDCFAGLMEAAEMLAGWDPTP